MLTPQPYQKKKKQKKTPFYFPAFGKNRSKIFYSSAENFTPKKKFLISDPK